MDLDTAVVSLNNSSVKLMLRGDYREALKGFRRALNMLKRGFVSNKMVVNEGAMFENQREYLHRVTFWSNHDETSPHNDFLFYSRTLWVNDDNIDETLMAMVVLFNLAVTFHHTGLHSSTASLHKSIELYKMILGLAQSCHCHHTDGFVRILLAAVFSNMGHIYSHFFSMNEAGICRTHLEQIMESGCPLLDPEEYWLFALNSDRAFGRRGNNAPAA